ncbi:hypothetical protein ABK040_007716 [Willaertia magna]
MQRNGELEYNFANYNNPKIPGLNQRFQIDIRQQEYGIAQAQPLEGLSKPAISQQLFICGTENQTPKASNFLILGSLEEGKVLSVQTIDDHIRYLEWLPKDQRRIVTAMNSELGIIVLNPELTDIQDIDLFPRFHTDTIRQLAVNPANQSLVISGGFDEKVFVTDISKLVDDIQSNQTKSENSVYLCQDVVSSVRFHPSDSNVASATTDQGILHVFDIRTGQTSKPAFVYDTGKIELNTHTYLDDFTVCLGYGDGFIQVHDIRSGKTLLSVHDKVLGVVGDFHFDIQKKILLATGIPTYAMYQIYNNTFEWITSGFTPTAARMNGMMVPNIQQNLALMTDSNGIISLYEL